MHIGLMNTLLTVQQYTVARSDSGEPVKTWSTLKQIWAQEEYASGGEAVKADRETAFSIRKFRTRYDSGINRTMRLVDRQSVTYKIEKIEPLRYGMMRIYAREVE